MKNKEDKNKQHSMIIMLRKFLTFMVLFIGICRSEYLLMDEESEELIHDIVNFLKTAANYKSQINVAILNNPTLNAMATEDGYIIVHSGAITQCKDVKELIAILAHEVVHIVENHVLSFKACGPDFMKAGLVPALIGVLASVATMNPTPLIGGLLANQSISSSLALSKLRQKENLADSGAIKLVEKLKWPVLDGFVTLYQKLSDKSVMHVEYLSTHPLDEKRISKMRDANNLKHETSSESLEILSKLEKRFQRIKCKVQSLTLSEKHALETFKNAKTDNEKYAKAIALYRNNKFKEAIAVCDEILENAENVEYISEIKAMSLIQLQRSSEAIDIAWAILQNNQKHKYRDLGIIYADAVYESEKNAHYKNAKKYLLQIKARNQNDPTVLNCLGKIYTLLGDNKNASLCAAEVSMILGDYKTAKYHAKNASETSNKHVSQNAKDISNVIKNYMPKV